MNAIRILPEHVASQIAAGEVVDRPASVVRELLDNSVDAASDRIVITIEDGGKKLIRISDNGTGMSRDDLLLCIERHATSKIGSVSDLYSIKSLGFRGEALPSIASVSQMLITSRPKDEIGGYKLKIDGGKLISIDETGSPAGTMVEIKNLFFNVPARRKFLRTAKTEMDQIVEVLSRIALPFPGISFILKDYERTILNLPAVHNYLPRFFSLMGRKVAEDMVKAEKESPEITIKAYLASPDMSRTRGDHLYFYVNGRNIRDKLITRAVVEGYGQRLMKGRYPQAAVFIDVDPSEVDVNVHPTKQEVKFNNSTMVFQAIARTIETAFSHSVHPLFGDKKARSRDALVDSDHKEHQVFASEPAWNYSQTLFSTAPPAKLGKLPQQPHVRQPSDQTMIGESPEVIGQLGNTYILCQVKDGLLLIDQHAAHERVVYENLKNSFASSHIDIQALLLPHQLELSAKETRIVLENEMYLTRIGIELDHFGGNTFLLRSHPAILKEVAWDTFFSELIDGLGRVKAEEASVFDGLLAVMACHGAIRAGDNMTREEMILLLDQLEGVDLPTNCPHGRPVFKHFSYYEIEKMFKRVV